MLVDPVKLGKKGIGGCCTCVPMDRDEMEAFRKLLIMLKAPPTG